MKRRNLFKVILGFFPFLLGINVKAGSTHKDSKAPDSLSGRRKTGFHYPGGQPILEGDILLCKHLGGAPYGKVDAQTCVVVWDEPYETPSNPGPSWYMRGLIPGFNGYVRFTHDLLNETWEKLNSIEYVGVHKDYAKYWRESSRE